MVSVYTIKTKVDANLKMTSNSLQIYDSKHISFYTKSIYLYASVYACMDWMVMDVLIILKIEK